MEKGGFLMEKREERDTTERLENRNRLSSSYCDVEYEKIDRLAMACGISKTTLQSEFMRMALDSEEMINTIQQRFRRKARYRIIPSRVDGELQFILAEKKRWSR